MKEETTKVHRGTFLKKGPKKQNKHIKKGQKKRTKHIKKGQKSWNKHIKKGQKNLGELWDDQSSQRDIVMISPLPSVMSPLFSLSFPSHFFASCFTYSYLLSSIALSRASRSSYLWLIPPCVRYLWLMDASHDSFLYLWLTSYLWLMILSDPRSIFSLTYAYIRSSSLDCSSSVWP